MSGPIAGIRYHYDSTAKLWKAPGRPSLAGIDTVTDRTQLVRGAYEPDETTTGPLPSYTTFTQVEADSSGIINLTQAGGVWNGTHYVYDGYEFWGTIAFREPKIKVTNCLGHGGSPATSAKPGIKNYGPGYYHGVIENSTFDPYAWYESGRFPMMTALTYINRPGLHGGDVEMRWCRIKNFEDQVGWVQNDDIGAADTGNKGYDNGAGWVVPAGQRFTVIDRCFFDQGSYVNGPDYITAMSGGQSGGYPHCDIFQFNTGRNLWITGCKLGNVRTPAAYATWGTDPQNPPVSKDAGTSVLMVQQEGTAPINPGDPRYLDNILVEDSVLAGGVATMNVILKNGNDLSGLTFRNLKMFQRQANWGVRQESGVLTSGTTGLGYYVIKSGTTTPTWQNVTVKETGASIPFTQNP